jgi:hypothetical protein
MVMCTNTEKEVKEVCKRLRAVYMRTRKVKESACRDCGNDSIWNSKKQLMKFVIVFVYEHEIEKKYLVKAIGYSKIWKG